MWEDRPQGIGCYRARSVQNALKMEGANKVMLNGTRALKVFGWGTTWREHCGRRRRAWTGQRACLPRTPRAHCSPRAAETHVHPGRVRPCPPRRPPQQGRHPATLRPRTEGSRVLCGLEGQTGRAHAERPQTRKRRLRSGPGHGPGGRDGGRGLRLVCGRAGGRAAGGGGTELLAAPRGRSSL